MCFINLESKFYPSKPTFLGYSNFCLYAKQNFNINGHFISKYCIHFSLLLICLKRYNSFSKMSKTYSLARSRGAKAPMDIHAFHSFQIIFPFRNFVDKNRITYCSTQGLLTIMKVSLEIIQFVSFNFFCRHITMKEAQSRQTSSFWNPDIFPISFQTTENDHFPVFSFNMSTLKLETGWIGGWVMGFKIIGRISSIKELLLSFVWLKAANTIVETTVSGQEFEH